MGAADLPLPGKERDAPKMLPARPVLWEHAGPVLPVPIHLDAADLVDHAYSRTAQANGSDRLGALVDDGRVPLVEDDPEPEDTSWMRRDRSISEVETQEARVPPSIDLPTRTDRAPFFRRPPPGVSSLAPVAHSASGYPCCAGDRAVVQPGLDQPPHNLDLGIGTHRRMVSAGTDTAGGVNFR